MCNRYKVHVECAYHLSARISIDSENVRSAEHIVVNSVTGVIDQPFHARRFLHSIESVLRSTITVETLKVYCGQGYLSAYWDVATRFHCSSLPWIPASVDNRKKHTSQAPMPVKGDASTHLYFWTHTCSICAVIDPNSWQSSNTFNLWIRILCIRNACIRAHSTPSPCPWPNTFYTKNLICKSISPISSGESKFQKYSSILLRELDDEVLSKCISFIRFLFL